MHLLSQLSVGMDLTKITLPTFILERRSLLEMFADFFAHPDLYAKYVILLYTGTKMNLPLCILVSLIVRHPKIVWRPLWSGIYRRFTLGEKVQWRRNRTIQFWAKHSTAAGTCQISLLLKYVWTNFYPIFFNGFLFRNVNRTEAHILERERIKWRSSRNKFRIILQVCVLHGLLWRLTWIYFFDFSFCFLRRTSNETFAAGCTYLDEIEIPWAINWGAYGRSSLSLCARLWWRIHFNVSEWLRAVSFIFSIWERVGTFHQELTLFFVFRSILTTPWVELVGKCSIKCEKTGYYADVEFQAKVSEHSPW